MAGSKQITAAGDPWPPFVDPQNPKEGLSLEIVRSALKSEGYSVKMNYVPWARAIKKVKEGKYDILPDTWFSPKRATYLKYSDPYASNSIKFIKKKNDNFEYNGIKSLKGKRIGIIRGYGYSKAFMNSKLFKKDVTSDLILNIKKLIKGRIDLTLEDEIVARIRIAQKNPKLIEKLSFSQKALSSENLYITCGLKNPRYKEIINAFNRGLKKIKADGTYNSIMATYGIK